MVELTLDGVGKAYGDAVALDGVDLAVEEGEFFTLVGPSGCGKTTTLRLIAGLESPTEGTIRFDGEDVADVPTEDRDVGIVFQNYALFPHMTVRENVRYGLKFREPPGEVTPDERVDELLALVDLDVMGDRDPEELSGGQQQRVALARALAPAPRLLLLDEPMSALDARLREQLRRQVRAIQDDLDVTTVYVTHDQEEALAVSDRLAVLHDGAVEQVGTPQAVYEAPATEFVASFVGENNRFAGEVIERDDDGLLVDLDVGGDPPAGEGRVRVAGRTGARDEATTRRAGERVSFCVRPENLVVADRGGDGPTSGDRAAAGVAGGDAAADIDQNRLTVTVETAEYLGASTRVYGEWAGERVVVRTSDPPGRDVLRVTFDPTDATLL